MIKKGFVLFFIFTSFVCAPLAVHYAFSQSTATSSIEARTAATQNAVTDALKKIDAEAKQRALDSQRELNYRILRDHPEIAPYFNPETGEVDLKKFNEDLPERYKQEFMKGMEQIDAIYRKLNEEKSKINEGPMRIEIPKDAGLPNEEVTLTSVHPEPPYDNVYAWYVDGVKMKEGLGETTFSVKTPGKIGAAKKIELETKPAPFSKSKDTYKTNIELRAADADLHYEGINYVPPEYKGKKNAAENGYVLIEMTPYFKTDAAGEFLQPALINFTWTGGAGSSEQLNGLGKNTLVMPIESPIMVTVKAEDIVRKTTIEKSIFVRPVRAEATLVKIDQKKTISIGNAQKDVVMKKTPTSVYWTPGGETVEFRVEPYFFSVENMRELDVQWNIEEYNFGEPKLLRTPEKNKEQDQSAFIFTLKIPERKNLNPGMVSSITASITNKNYPSQAIESSINLRLIEEGEQ
jgi:hypothetical protein